LTDDSDGSLTDILIKNVTIVGQPKYRSYAHTKTGTIGLRLENVVINVQCLDKNQITEEGKTDIQIKYQYLETEPHTGFNKLFNGIDFTGFYTFLREEGINKDPKKVFTMGKDSSIHVSGEQFGYFCTTDTFANFHLKLQFKWGDKKHAPRLNQPRDAGVLYHFQTHQKDTIWPVSLECQI
jgi:Domain of Unknown Function (DUF1080)